MEGVLSFADWANDKNSTWATVDAWNAARQGMIPAANAIEIPDEKTWPDYATHCYVSFLKDGTDDKMCDRDPKYRPRSKPAWTPCDTDVIVYWDEEEKQDMPVKLYKEMKVKWNHYAKVEQLSDIGHDIAWFKANRPWI